MTETELGRNVSNIYADCLRLISEGYNFIVMFSLYFEDEE